MGTAAAVGAGANIVGGELSGWANVLDKYAMQRVYADEIKRQNAFADQAAATYHPESYGAAAMQQGMDTGAANRRAAYQQIGQVPLGTGPNVMSNYKPDVASAYTDMLGQARSKLGGYSDWAVQQAISNLNTQRSLDQISNFAGSQAKNVFPQQMYAAQHANDTMAMIGQAISSIGGGSANYAAYNQQAPQSPGLGYAVPTSANSYGMWSGYGGYGNLPPQGTGYNPYSNQSTAPSLGSTYGGYGYGEGF